MDSTRLSALHEREAITDVVRRYASGVDSRDWPSYRSCFSDVIEVDMSSWSGAPASRIPADAWVRGVRAGLSGFDSTQHMLSNHRVEFAPPAKPGVAADGVAAHCTSYIQARHWLDQRCYTLAGYYDNDLVLSENGWRIERCRLTVTWNEGPREIFDLASDRFAELESQQDEQ